MTQSGRRKVLIAGGSGLVGHAAAKYFASLDDWDVVSLSRRSPSIPGVEACSVDLTDAEACHGLFQKEEFRDVTHIVYAAMAGAHGQTPYRGYHRDPEQNLRMLQNVLGPLQAVAGRLEHVSVVHGENAYGTNVDGIALRLPFREHHPRVEHRNFYFDQEDYLVEEQRRRGTWTFTIWRPGAIFGEAMGSPLNPIPALGVYGAVLRERGEPLWYPGNPQWRIIRDATDTETLAQAFAWAAEAPAARNQTYNVNEGEPFTYYDIWPCIASAMGMEAGDARPHSLAEESQTMERKWGMIVDKYALDAPKSLSKFAGDSFAFLDGLLGYNRLPATKIFLSSTIKLRQHGFHECTDTENVIRKWFTRLQDNRKLPPV